MRIALFLALALLVAFEPPGEESVCSNVPYCLPDQICVLVAQFEPEGDKPALTSRSAIYDQLDQLLSRIKKDCE